MAVVSVSKITAASPTSFDAAVQEGLSRANKTLRGITGLHVIEQKASVRNGKILARSEGHHTDLERQSLTVPGPNVVARADGSQQPSPPGFSLVDARS